MHYRQGNNLITGSYATAHMLKAYQMFPDQYDDKVDLLGRPGPNGIPDILDEAAWGLQWILKMHPAPDLLFHQVGDDRDHIGWEIPDNDKSDYGWGEKSYRVVYFATGEPQGLREYKSEATGVSNLAGRFAAALAMGYTIWKDDPQKKYFADRCLRSAQTVFDLGLKNEGYQQGNMYNVGVPFIWCSNNLLTSLVTQIILYENMTSNTAYHDFMNDQVDWLFGVNPWGTSMFTGIPEGGEYPVDIHTSIWALKGEEVAGGLVDGPVYSTIFNSLKGIALSAEDEFAEFQNNFVVYHDDISDYSTNEPTMDGTAGSIIMMSYLEGRDEL